jgi:hypothetical protein
MLGRENGQVVRGKKEPTCKAIIGNNDSQMNIAVLKAAWQSQSAVLYKMYLYAWMPDLILAQKRRKHVLNNHWRRSNAQDSSMPALESPRFRIKRISFHQQSATLPQQLFALRRQPQTSTNAVEQTYSELSLKRENLARGSWLADIHPRASARNAA